MAKKLKTLKNWENKHSDLELDQYLHPMDEVDEELYHHCATIVSPQYLTRDFLQMGEAEFGIDGVYFFSTFAYVGDKYYYLGKLPEFIQ